MTVLELDRTKEFQEIVECIKQKQKLQQSNQRIEKQSQPTPITRTQFTRHASHIARGIHETSTKLATLTQMTKKLSPFPEENEKISVLTIEVKNSLRVLNKEIELLRESIGKPLLTNYSKNNQPQRHSEEVINFLHHHLQDTTSEFKVFLENRTDKLKEQQNMSIQYTGKPVSGRARRIMPSPEYNDSTGTSSVNNGEVSITIPSQSTVQQQQLRQFNYASARLDAVRSIEETIVELHGMFQQLGTIVAEQQDTIDRIDTNVSETMNNMVGVEGNLLKYLARVTSNRWLIVKIFLVLIIFIIIFIVLFV